MTINLAEINCVEHNGIEYRFLGIERHAMRGWLIYDCKDGVMEWVSPAVVHEAGIPILFISRSVSDGLYEAKGKGFSFKFDIIPTQDSYGLMRLSYLDIDKNFKDSKLSVIIPEIILKYGVGIISDLFSTLYVGHEHIDWLEVLLDCKYCIQASDLFLLVRAKRVDLYIKSIEEHCDIFGLFRENRYIQDLRVKYIGKGGSITLEEYRFATDMNLKRFELYNVNFWDNCEICDFDKISYIVTNSYELIEVWLSTNEDKCTIFYDLGGTPAFDFRTKVKLRFSLSQVIYSYDKSKYSSLDTMITDCQLRHKRGSLIIFNEGF